MHGFEPLPGTENACAKKSGKKIRRVLGIDPGLASTGFGVVDYKDGRYRMVSYGVIETAARTPHGERLLALYARLCSIIEEFSLGEYTPNQIKQAVTGTSAADKALVEKYVKLLLALETEPKPDHAADALAGALTHLHYANVL